MIHAVCEVPGSKRREGESGLPRRRASLRELGPEAAILLLALALRLYAATGEMYFDPIIYAQNAYNILQGTFTLSTDSWYAHRLPVFVPLVPLYALLGVGPWVSRIWPLAVSLGQIGLLLWIGRRLFDRRVALLGGLFAALAPLDVIYGGILQPDIILAFFLTAAAAFWILSLEEAGRHPRLFPLLSGLAFALAAATRENAVVLIVFYLGSALWRRPRARTLLWTALGGCLIAVPLLLLYGMQTGDPLLRLHIVTGAYGSPVMQEGARLGFYPSLLIHVRHTLTGLFPLLFLAGILHSLIRPRRERVWLLLWSLPMLLYLEFGSQGVTRYLPILKRDRFLTPLSAPLCLLAASVAADWASTLERRLPLGRKPRPSLRRGIPAGLLLAGVLILTVNSLLIVRDHRRQGRAAYSQYQAVVRLIRSRPDLPVLFDHWRTCYRFSYYLDFREGADFYRGADDRARVKHPGAFGTSRLGYLAWYPDSSSVPPAWIVLDQDALRQVEASRSASATYAPGEIPSYAHHPPRTWVPVGQYGALRVYRSAP